MKKVQMQFMAIAFLAFSLTGIISCGDGAAEEKPVETKDSSILDNYNNGYPNDRIHMQDSNASADSARMSKDTVK